MPEGPGSSCSRDSRPVESGRASRNPPAAAETRTGRRGGPRSGAKRSEGKLAAIGDGSGRGMERRRTFGILAPGQSGETFFVQDLPDGGSAQGSLLGLQGAFDVIDGKVLLAHPQDQ